MSLVNIKKRFYCGNLQKPVKGQSLVEFALVLVVLLLLLSGIFDFGRAIFTQFALQDAAEEGLVYGVAFPTECTEIGLRVLANLQDSILPSDLAPSVDIRIVNVPCKDVTDLEFGQRMDIRVSSPFVISMPFLAGNTITLTGSANGIIMRPPPIVSP